MPISQSDVVHEGVSGPIKLRVLDPERTTVRVRRVQREHVAAHSGLVFRAVNVQSSAEVGGLIGTKQRVLQLERLVNVNADGTADRRLIANKDAVCDREVVRVSRTNTAAFSCGVVHPKRAINLQRRTIRPIRIHEPGPSVNGGIGNEYGIGHRHDCHAKLSDRAARFNGLVVVKAASLNGKVRFIRVDSPAIRGLTTRMRVECQRCPCATGQPDIATKVGLTAGKARICDEQAAFV